MRELGERRSYGSWDVFDTLRFSPMGATLDSGTVLRGQLNLRGGHEFVTGRFSGQWTRRTITVDFAATFDPRPAPAAGVMSLRQQQRIMYDALYEFAIQWVHGAVEPVTPDSTRVDTLARAFLLNRWSDAATVDSLSVGPAGFYVRLRGRYVPVTCEVILNSSAPYCKSR